MRSEVACESNVAVVGAGFRSTSLLSSDARLLEGSLTVIERQPTGSSTPFREYDTMTTSIGSKFFQYVDYHGPFTALLSDKGYMAVARSSKPVHMTDLSVALNALEEKVRLGLGERFLSGTEIGVVEVESGAGVTLLTQDGRAVRTRHAVLATGRREVLAEELVQHSQKVEFSGEFIKHSNDLAERSYRGDFSQGPIVILGCSHSAMSAVRRALQSGCASRGSGVAIIQRSPARLMYGSLEHARGGFVEGRERRADPVTDVCPTTGIVFRDSGLRNSARELYCAIWAGEVEGVELVQMPSTAEREALLEGASVIVQAVGYQPNCPVISVDGEVRFGRQLGTLEASENADAIVDGVRIPELSMLRVGQTPRALRDHSDFGADLYRRMRLKLGRL